jgi:hypothetical protein
MLEKCLKNLQKDVNMVKPLNNKIMKKKYCSSSKQFCCNSLRIFSTYRSNPEPGALILYSPVSRSYSIPIGSSEEKGTDVSIEYCPFCGTKFPCDLNEKWCEVIRTELGEDYLPDSKVEFEKFLCEKTGEKYMPDPNRPIPKSLPKEFKTDEWWKKRGL